MQRPTRQEYAGLDEDYCGGMTPTGTLVRDAQVFGLIPETESCAGWNYGRLEDLNDKVAEAWAPYGHLASRLPPDVRARHERIFGAAILRARELGWAPNLDDEE